jgi:hypothetical protein
LSDVHDSDARQLPKIPRRGVRRTRVERANPRRGLGTRSEGPRGAFRSRSRTDCRLKGFHSARSQSSSQDCRCTITTASSWSTLSGALHLIVAWPARWGSADAHSCFGAARFGRIDRSTYEVYSRLGAFLYICHHRLVKGCFALSPRKNKMIDLFYLCGFS